MRFNLFASPAVLLALALAPISPANATIAVASCTDGSPNRIPCGGQTPGTATPLTEVLNTINMNGYLGSQWFEFSWGGGTLGISATNTDVNYELVLDTAALRFVDSDVFSGGGSPYSATLSESNLAAGNYVVGLNGNLVDPNGTLGFSANVGAPRVPEPGSLALLLSGLFGVRLFRRRS